MTSQQPDKHPKYIVPRKKKAKDIFKSQEDYKPQFVDSAWSRDPPQAF